MITETILKPIGNGQITIPLARREKLGINKKHVKARLEGQTIIIESLEKNNIDRDISTINFNSLNKETKLAIETSHKNYKSKKTNAFISHEDIRHDV